MCDMVSGLQEDFCLAAEISVRGETQSHGARCVVKSLHVWSRLYVLNGFGGHPSELALKDGW